MAIQNDLSRGNYLLTQKPFQIEAWAYPFRYVPVLDGNGDLEVFNSPKPANEVTPLNVSEVGKFLEVDLGGTYNYYEVVEDFDLQIWDESEFTSVMFPNHTLDQLRDAQGVKDIGNRPIGFLVNVNKNSGELTALEQSKLNNTIRIQWHDDDLHPNNSLVNTSGEVLTDPGATGPFDSIEPPSIIGLGRDYFNAKRSDADYDDILLSIDPPPANYNDAQWTEYINAIQPDLILHNNYPWQNLPVGMNKRQAEYGVYAKAILWSNRAQAGGDALNPVAKPIAWGGFLQTSNLLGPGIMSYTYRKYQAFFYLTFGAKFLSAFTYNDYPNDHTIGIESYLFDQNGVPLQEDPQPTSEFFKQAELNRKLKIIGNTLKLLQATGQRFIRATNIEFVNPQGIPFAAGVYDWDYETRPDTRLIDVIVSRDDFPKTQDVWVGYFNPVHNSLDGSGTTDETYFMICNGSWNEDENLNIRQRIRMEFDFGSDDSITNIIKLSTDTGNLEVIPLIPTGNNTYYYEHVLEAGEADLFKYDTGVQFLGDPTPQVASANEEDFEPPFNYPGGFRVSNGDPIDADRYIQNSIAERNLLVTQGRAKEGQQCYVKNTGDNTSELFVLKGQTNLDWEPIWKSPFQSADMFKQEYDTDNSGVVDNAELLSGRILNESETPNSVVSRDSNGDINARLFKSTFPNAADIAVDAAVAMRNTNLDNNNFIRFVTKAAFATWLGFNKATIDSLGIDAGSLSGRLLNFNPDANSVAGRDVNGFLSAQGFKLLSWEIKQVGAVLVLTTTVATVDYQLQFPTSKNGTIALTSDINKTAIDALGINAARLSGRLVSYDPTADTIALRTVTGFLNAQGFTTLNWEISQVGGVLVFKNTVSATDYQVQLPVEKSGTIALVEDFLNGFSVVAVSGQTNLVAQTRTDTLTFIAGANITISLDETTNSITINSTASGGGGAVDSVNGEVGVVVLNADDIDDSATTHKFATAAELAQISTNNSAISTLQTDKAEKSNVLELDNTTPFTPSSDHNPATKKYVDDSVSNAGGGDMTKAVYDTNGNNIVDDSEALGGQDSSYHLDRTNHTGTQAASTISDFDTEVSNNSAVSTNTNAISNLQNDKEDKNKVCTESANVSGIVNLDISTFDYTLLNLTGNITDFTLSNTPASGFGRIVTVRTVPSSGEQITLPASWVKYGNINTLGVNKLTLHIQNYPTTGLIVDCYINQPNV